MNFQKQNMKVVILCLLMLAVVCSKHAARAGFRSFRPHLRHSPMTPHRLIQASNSSHMTTPREAHGFVGLPGGTLFAIGGTNLETFEVLNSTEIYDIATNTWSPGPPMIQNRELGAVAIVEDKFIYVFGGQYEELGADDDGILATSIEIYDIAAKKWTMGPEVKWTRESFSVGVIGTKIYIVGGQKDDGNSITLKSVLVFDTVTNKTTLAAEMNQRRSDFGVAVVDGKIYAFGGFDLEINYPIGQFVDSIEQYDPITNKWTMLDATMSLKKGAFGYGAVGQKIVAAGGFWDGPRPRPHPHPTTGGVIKDVQVFDTTKGVWTKGANLKTPRTDGASAVVNAQLWVCGGENDVGDELNTLERVQV